MAFYTFYQNNSGGSFISSSDLAQYTIIQGDSFNDITKKALKIGIYFNGCDNDIDCECCGDRWSEPDRDYDDLTDAPQVFGELPSENYVIHTIDDKVHDTLDFLLETYPELII